MLPDTFTQGIIFEDEGFATYAKTSEGDWVSINGEPGKIIEVRWTVSDPEKIKRLEGIVAVFKGPARYFRNEQ